MNLQDPGRSQAIPHLLVPLRDGEAVMPLSVVRVGSLTDTSGEDALTVLNRKLETAGVIASGQGAPDFASQTALFFFDTQAERLYVRETSTYTPLAIGTTEDVLIGHAASLPEADATTPWIFVKTDLDGVYLKERTGAPGAYAYSWVGPIFAGSARTAILYHTDSAPPALAVSWNWINDNLNVTSGGWTESGANAKSARIVTLPRNSNRPLISPIFRIGTPGPEEIEFTAKDGRGNLPASANNLQEVIDWLDTATLGSSGNPVNQTAAQVPTNTRDFAGNLSTDDDDVQQALDTLDKLDVPPYLSERLAHTDNLITAEQQYYSENFSIPQRLRDYRDRFDQVLYIVVDVNIDIQENAGSPGATMAFALEVLDSLGMELSPPRLLASSPATQNDGDNPVTVKLRVQGVLPNDFNAGRVITECTEIVRGGFGAPAAGVRYYSIQVYPDSSAIDSRGFDGNLSPTDNTIQEIAQALDDLQITEPYLQRENLGNITVTSSSSEAVDVAANRVSIRAGIVDEGGERLENALAITAVYDIVAPPSLTGTIGRLVLYSEPNLDDAGTVYGTLPLLSNNFQNGRKLIVKGEIPFSANMANGFYPVLEIAQRTSQIQVTLNNGLTVIQLKPARAAAEVTVDADDFRPPTEFIGGLRHVTGVSGIADAPANVEQALIKTDFLLSNVFNPYEGLQVLNHEIGGTTSDSFLVNSATLLYSNPVTIPAALRALGADVDVRVRVQLSALGAGFVGDLRLVDPSNRTTIFYGDAEAVNNTIYSQGDYVTFHRTIAAASVPATFALRYRRTSSSGTATFGDGFTHVIASPSRGAMGGVGGQTGGFSERIIWHAGISLTGRLTTESETTNYTLLAGNRFTDFDFLQFVFDFGAASTQPLAGYLVSANLFHAAGANGFGEIKGPYWLLPTYQSPTTFRLRWCTPPFGFRRIIGITF